MQNALIYIIVALGASTVINIILKKYGLSVIIGYIFTGVILSYGFDLKGMTDTYIVEEISEFGIVFLMFTIGLEISLAKMNTMKHIIFVNGFMQLFLTTVVVYLSSIYFFALDEKTALIVSLSFSLSSTAVVLSYLKSSKEIYSAYGQRSTGILIFQDIAVIPILILIGILSSENSQTLSVIIYDTIVSATVVLAGLYLVGKRLIAYLLKFSASSELDELFMSSVFFIVFGASLLAHAVGFTYSLGAFIVGMIIAETKYHHKVEADIAPFKDLLLGVFFIVVGMKIDIALFVKDMPSIFGLFLLVLVLKALIIFIVLRFSATASVSLKTALSLSQVGEFSFVVFALAGNEGIMDKELVQILVLVVILSMMVTPLFISKVRNIAGFFIKEKEEIPEVIDMQQKQNHIIVCGYGVVGRFVREELAHYGVDCLIVDNNPKHVQKALSYNYEAYLGDMSKRSIVEALHVQNAAAVIVTLDNINKKRMICETILKTTKDVNLVVKVVSLEEKEMLKDLNISVVVDGKIEVAKVLVKRTMSCSLISS